MESLPNAGGLPALQVSYEDEVSRLTQEVKSITDSASSVQENTSSSTSNAASDSSTRLLDDDPQPLYIKGYRIQFPHKEPYASQKAFMFKVLNALTAKENALLESPTGSGKTLALLCSSLAWLTQERANHSFREVKIKPRVFFLSRTHSQLEQVISELRATSYRPSMAVLGSRDHFCIHPKARNTKEKDVKGSSLNERCQNLLKDAKCRFFHNSQKLNRFGKQGTLWDIEDIVQEATKIGACPYYGSRNIAENAEFILAPYNYVLDPVIRKSMDINLSNSVIIIDEAHNVENVSRDSASKEFRHDEIILLYNELKHLSTVVDPSYVQIFTTLQDFIGHMGKFIMANSEFLSKNDFEKEQNVFRGDQILEFFDQLGCSSENYKTFISCIGQASAHAAAVGESGSTSDEAQSSELEDSFEEETKYKSCLSHHSLSILEAFGQILSWIFSSDHKYLYDYRMVILRQMVNDGQSDGWIASLGFWCMNPAVAFQEFCKGTHSIILTSGTLSPLTSFASELGVEFKHRLETGHVVPKSSIFARPIAFGPTGIRLECTFRRTEELKFQDDVGCTLKQIFDATPDGTLVFFPSYTLMEKLAKRWKQTGLWKELNNKKKIFMESRASDKFYNDLQKYLEFFEGKTKSCGASFFAVCRGKISEGIDFSDQYARCVVSIGIPYPHAKDLQVNLKRNYNEQQKRKDPSRIGGKEWYEQQAYRALNQAVGRCIRHRQDFGAILLIDSRFSEWNAAQNLPKWVRECFPVEKIPLAKTIEELMNFFVKFETENPNLVTPKPIKKSRRSALFFHNTSTKIEEEKHSAEKLFKDSKSFPPSSTFDSSSIQFEEESKTSPSPLKGFLIDLNQFAFTSNEGISRGELTQSKSSVSKGSLLHNHTDEYLLSAPLSQSSSHNSTEVQVDVLGFAPSKKHEECSDLSDVQKSINDGKSVSDSIYYDDLLFCNCGSLLVKSSSNHIHQILPTGPLLDLLTSFSVLNLSTQDAINILSMPLHSVILSDNLFSSRNVVNNFQESLWNESEKSVYIPLSCGQCSNLRALKIISLCSSQSSLLAFYITRKQSNSEEIKS